jgi:hypothetical protein
MKRSNFISLLAAAPSIALLADNASARDRACLPHYDITKFGGDPSGKKDSSKALLAMMAAYRKQERQILFPAGKFVFKDPQATIEILHKSRKSGIYIQGAGIDRTTLVFNVPNKSAIRLINEGDSQFTWGNYLGHLTIDGNYATKGRGLELIGQWLGKIEFVRLTKFGSDAIWFPDRSDLNRRWSGKSRKLEDVSSDRWSSAFFTIENSFINGNSGWGIRNDAGSAWSNIHIRNTGIFSNRSGGIYKPGPNFNFVLGAIAYNGGPGVLAGRSLDYTSYGLLFDRVEFESNRRAHLVLNAVKDSTFSGCRFIHDEDPQDGFRLHPSKTVEINANSTQYKYDVVQNIKFINPKIRWKNTRNHKLTIFDFNNSYNVNLIDIERLELNTPITADSPVILVTNIYAGLTHQRKPVTQNMSEHKIFYANASHPLKSQL